MWLRYQAWWQRQSQLQQWGWVSLVAATVLGSALRLTNLGVSMQFQADQGRDALIAYGILHGDVALVGPSTSVGSMFLGPIYYYFMAPFLGLAGYNPVGPTLAVAVIGILTIPLLFWVARQWLGSAVATLSVLLYMAAPWVVEFTRFSWNPNPAPAVSLLLWWSAWKALNGQPRWWALVGFWFAVLIQLHYVALLAIVPVGLLWLWQVGMSIRQSHWKALRQDLLWSFVAAVILLASFAPLVIFDLRFNGLIRSGFSSFFQSTDKPDVAIVDKLQGVWRSHFSRARYVLGQFWGGKDSVSFYRPLIRYSVFGAIGVWLLWGRRLWQRGESKIWIYLSLIVWTSMLGLGWYSGEVYVHYVSYLFPIVPLLAAGIILELRHVPFLGIIFSSLVWVVLLTGAMQPSSQKFLKPAGWQYTNMQDIAQLILSEVPGEKTYSLALLSEIRDYRGMNYRYFLTTEGRAPVDFAAANQADILVVVAENPDTPDEVLNSPVYEIATFPKGQYRVVVPAFGPKIYIIERAVALPQASYE